MGARKPDELPARKDAAVTANTPPKRRRRTDPLIGTVIAGNYKIVKKIGEGGMGSVYTATDINLDRTVAIKVLLGKLAEDEIAVRRFKQEAKAISKMQHPNTVTIFHSGIIEADNSQDEDRLYIVMEYLRGRTLTHVLRKEGELAPARACRIMRQVCASLADAHQAGIIHRDLKPDNIFLTAVGGDRDWVKVLDFGVAKLADAESAGTLTQTGMIFGTPKYMSPEQAEGRPIDYRADIYALGVVLYELLVGRPPFVADTPVALLLKHISHAPPPFSQVRPDLAVSPALEAIVQTALSKEPEKRFQQVADLAAALEAFEASMSGSYRPASMISGVSEVGQGLPTELIPGTLKGQALTPGGLVPPDAVPSNLSLGAANQRPEETADLNAPTVGLPKDTDADQVATAMGAVRGAGVGTEGALTHPLPAEGPSSTLGAEISGGLRPQADKPPAMLFVGLAFLAAAAVVAVYIVQTHKSEAPRQTRIVEVNEPEAPVKKAPPHVVAVPEDTDTPANQAPRTVATKTPDDVTKPPVRRSPERTAARPSRKAPRVAARKVSFSFQSDPKGALVVLDGEQIGRTPFSAEFAKEAGSLVFTIKKTGFETKKIIRSALRDDKVSITLKKKTVGIGQRCADGSPPPCTKIDKRPVRTRVRKPRVDVKRDSTTEKVPDLK